MRVSTIIRTTKGMQALIDTERRFRFVNYDGEVSLVDVTAAGGEMYHFRFHSGALAGKTLACEGDGQDCAYTYGVNLRSDGMHFNLDPDLRDSEGIDDWGGDFAPDYDGTIFYLMEN